MQWGGQSYAMRRSKLRVSERRAEFHSSYPEREQFRRRQRPSMTTPFLSGQITAQRTNEQLNSFVCESAIEGYYYINIIIKV